MGFFRSAQAGALLSKSAPLRAHVFVGLLLYGSFYLSAMSIPHLSTTVFLAAKSVKSLFTMLVAALWLRKRFGGGDWGAAALSACGLAMCLGVGSGGAGSCGSGGGGGGGGAGSASWLGAVLILGSMGCDGGAANAQDAVMRQFGTPTSELALRAYGVAAAAGLAQGAATGDLPVALALLRRDVALAAALAVYGAASMVATACTLNLIGAFGASSFMFMSTAAKGAQLGALLLGRGDRATPQQTAGFAVMFVAAGMAAHARAKAERAVETAAALVGAARAAPPSPPLPARATAAAAAAHLDATPELGALRQRRGGAAAAPAAPPPPPSPPPPAPLSLRPAGAANAPASPSSPLARLRSEASGVLTAATALALGIARPAPAVETLSPIATAGSGKPERGGRARRRP
jgi:drug/metabolite transporter (DMT)-like permease